VRKYLFLATLLAAIVCLVACHTEGERGGLDRETARHLAEYFEVHPRLILGPEKLAGLRVSVSNGNRELWQRYLEDLPQKVSAAAHMPEQLDRGNGDLAADLAFAWLMTGEDSLYIIARDYLFELCRKPVWDPEYDLLHGHLLLGAALAYDWMYGRLSRDQRFLVADRLGEEAEAQYDRITQERAWYRNQYLQNHAHVNYCGLAYAAGALYGEDPRAVDWLGCCDSFFARVFDVSNPDGGSIEGLSYGNYAEEYCLRYAELARDLLGRDYYKCDWLRNYPEFVLHSLLPAQREDCWAMTFGDSPRHGNSHGPEPQLYLLAARTGDREALWLADRLVAQRDSGLASASWWALTWHTGSVQPASPAGFPLQKHFTDLDQLMLRSAWEDSTATLIGIKCGPFMGRRESGVSAYDLGAAHGHPDAGSFQIFSRGRFLTVDPGYTLLKRTANHNTLLVRGKGQLGEGEPWFATGEALAFEQYPRLVEVRSTDSYDYALADLSRAYHPGLGLERFRRHFLYLRPDMLLVADEIELASGGALYDWGADSLMLTGDLSVKDGNVVGERGTAGVVFPGPDGVWSVGLSYVDNSPGTGSYTLLVDSSPLYAWKDTVKVTDTHYQVIPEVRLKNGSRIEVRGAPLGKGARLLKLAVWDRHAPSERSVDWLLHFEPGTQLSREFTRIQALNGPVALDVYPLAPERRSHDWSTFAVEKGLQLKTTERLVIRPVFTDSSVVLLNLLHVRSAGAPPLDRLSGGVQRGQAWLRWFERGGAVNVGLDLATGAVTIQRANANP